MKGLEKLEEYVGGDRFAERHGYDDFYADKLCDLFDAETVEFEWDSPKVQKALAKIEKEATDDDYLEWCENLILDDKFEREEYLNWLVQRKFYELNPNGIGNGDDARKYHNLKNSEKEKLDALKSSIHGKRHSFYNFFDKSDWDKVYEYIIETNNPDFIEWWERRYSEKGDVQNAVFDDEEFLKNAVLQWLATDGWRYKKEVAEWLDERDALDSELNSSVKRRLFSRAFGVKIK